MPAPTARPVARLFALVFALLALGAGGFIAYRFFAAPRVREAAPGRARQGDTVTLRGERFGAEPRGNVVLFGERSGRVVGATPTEIRVEVPDLAVKHGQEVRIPVRVVVGERVSSPLELVVYEAPIIAEIEMLPEPTRSPELAPAPLGLPPQAPPGVQEVPPPEAQRPPRRASRPATKVAPATGGAPIPEKPPEGLAPAGGTPLRAFVVAETRVESRKSAGADLKGFEAAEVKRAPEVPGRIDFEVTPAQVKSGDPYTVRVYLWNDGTKPIKVEEMTVLSIVNETRSRGAVKPGAKEVPPQQRALLAELPGVWREGVSSWTMEVVVVSSKGDRYRSQVAWK